MYDKQRAERKISNKLNIEDIYKTNINQITFTK